MSEAVKTMGESLPTQNLHSRNDGCAISINETNDEFPPGEFTNELVVIKLQFNTRKLHHR
jgi:hypothetical protein